MLRTTTGTILAVGALVLASACDDPFPTSPDGGVQGPQINTSEAISLIAGLHERNYELDFQGAVESPIFPAPTDLYFNDDEDVRFYGFASVEDAEAAVATISADGRTVDGSPVPWTEPIHFYHTERLVVVYLGDRTAFHLAISDIMGGQVAGD